MLIAEPTSITNRSSPAAKIGLFRSLFRGREDVYPRRFVSRKTGKSGYAPACANEWIRGVCEKPRVKCTDCPNRRFLPVSDETIRWHLSGEDAAGQEFTIGVYPMLLDETCFFLAVDFDGEGWQQDAEAFLDTCRNLDLPVALERSRSGNGGHAWFFFADAIPAHLARKLGSHILTETMDQRPDIGLDSYDRLFPNQDTLPNGGFGNLIALPLRRRPRDRGNSIFLDTNLEPYPDQWAYLSSLPRIERERVDTLVREAENKGRIVGVRMALADEDDDTPGPPHPHVARANRRSPDRCPRKSRSCWPIRSTSQRKICRPSCEIVSSGSRPSRTRSFTGLKRCACQSMTSRASFTARRTIPGTSRCRVVASTRRSRL